MKRFAEQTSKDTIRRTNGALLYRISPVCALCEANSVPNKGMPPLRCLRHLSQRTLRREQSADADSPRRKV